MNASHTILDRPLTAPQDRQTGMRNALAAMAFALLVLPSTLTLFYTSVYSVHQDLAGAALSAKLANVLGPSFGEYGLFFPPAERFWFSFSVTLNEWTGLRLDLAVVAITSVAVIISAGFAYHIRNAAVGATALFFIASIAVLVILPILYKNIFGLREHLVILGLWPYLVLRASDPDGQRIGWKTRFALGVWMGATLSLKYVYALVVLLVEIADALLRRRPLTLFRIENLVSGAIVAMYLNAWLVLNPEQREAMAVVVTAIEANLAPSIVNFEQAVLWLSSAGCLLALAMAFKVPARTTYIGLAMVVAAIVASWIQSRWYTHHHFPITMAYLAWLWIARDNLKPLWLIAVGLLTMAPVLAEHRKTSVYQSNTQELSEAMDKAGVSLAGKRVGVLAMHPAPMNEYLAAQGAIRWNTSVNIAYLASELQPLDRPENAGELSEPVLIEEPGRKRLHHQMLRLWEERLPDALILDESTSWPLRHITIKWEQAFANDPRFKAILDQYKPVFEHKGERLEFRYLERKE